MEIARQKAYRKTFDLACATLAGLSVEEQAAKAGLSLSKQGDAYVISVPSFDETIELAVPGFSFTSTKGSNITLTAKIIILHYLINASGMPLGAGLVPYEDVRGCRSYLPVFERRVVKPLLNAFGFARDAFNDAGSAARRQAGRIRQRLSSRYQPSQGSPSRSSYGKATRTFPPAIKVLFDKSIDTYVPLEDIV